ncbi:MAG: restriction endonuclease subunit S [Cyanobacteria bacterium J06626_6]
MTTVKKKLPRSWELTTLGLIAEIIMGQSPPGNSYNQEGEGTPLINGPVEFGPSAFSKTVRSKFTTAPKKFCKSDDLILCVRGSTTGRMNIAGFDASIGRGVAALRYPFCQNYLNTFIHAKREVIFRLGTGSTFPNVSSKVLDEIPIPLPPLKEQHRIVKKIESLTTHSRKAREALDAIPPLLDQFRQSVLAAAFRGDLTADWRAENLDVESGEELLRRVEEERRIEWEKFEFNRMKARGKTPKNSKWKERYKIPEIPEVSNLPEIPSSWQWVKLSTLCIEIGDVDHKMPKAQSDGYPYISTKDFLPSGAIDLNNSKKISEEDYIKLCRKISPEKGDILLSRYGTVGEVRVVEDSQPFQASYSIAILKVVSKDLSRFIGLGLSSEILQSQIKFWSRGVAQPDLGLKHIKEFAFPVPPVAEQIEILHRAESLLDAIMNIEVAYKSNESYLAQLDQSILAKAFRGDLVPQDPTDEPAHILLNRIRTEREKTQKAKKKTKRKKS